MTAKTRQEYIDGWNEHFEDLNMLMKTKGTMEDIKRIKEELKFIVFANANVIYKKGRG